MDSPHLQSSIPPQRVRTNSNLSVHSIDGRGAIRKRSIERERSVSTSQVNRLYELSLEQTTHADLHSLPTSSGVQWLTPEHSPQHPGVFAESSIEPFPTWTVPTPPRSDSGVPTVSIDANDEPAITGSSASQDFNIGQPTTSVEMSSLGFLLPSQYGSGLYESEPSTYTMEQNYIPPMKISQPTTSGSSSYSQTISSSPALYQSKTAPESYSSSRRHSELQSSGIDQSYSQGYRRVSSPYASPSGSQYSMSSASQSIPSISGLTQSPLPSPNMSASSSAGMMPHYNSSISRSPGLYDSNLYGQPFTTSSPSTQIYASAQSMTYPPPFVGSSVNEVLAKPLGSDSSIRVLNQRPKPQCWEHGCNGRQFSTFSNLLRHQREKSGTASKSYCPKCGAEFTRTTARNGHLAHDKCTKQRRPSEEN